MPLSILVPMILFGLPLVIGLVWWVNKGKQVPSLSDETAQMIFLVDYPNCVVEQVLVSDDGKNAFLKLQGRSELGLVHAVGQKFLTRVLDSQTVLGLTSSESAIHLRLQDFTLKQLSFEDENSQARAFLNGWLNLERS